MRTEAAFHVAIGSIDEPSQCGIIERAAGLDLDVPHEFAIAFEQVVRIGKLRAEKKSDVDVRLECTDLSERRVADARGRIPVMQ